MDKKSAFIEMIQENEGIIYKISKIYFDEEEDQRDLYQEIVFQLWKSFDSFKSQSKISTWMYRVALNTAISQLKKDKKKMIRVSTDQLDFIKMEAFDPLMEERISILYKHISNLNIVEKGIILLFLEGKSYDEIAQITGFTKTNIGSRLSRIKEKLRSKIKI